MDYTLAPPMQPWSWRRMLNGLKDATINRVVEKGITRIYLAPIKDSYDHKRHHAARKAERPYRPDAPVPVWDFVIERVDGTAVRLHPNATNNKVSIADMEWTEYCAWVAANN